MPNSKIYLNPKILIHIHFLLSAQLALPAHSTFLA
jgi:hypothetical protein